MDPAITAYLQNPENFRLNNAQENYRAVNHDEWATSIDHERRLPTGDVSTIIKFGLAVRWATRDSVDRQDRYTGFNDGVSRQFVMNDPRVGIYFPSEDFLDSRYSFGPSADDRAFSDFFLNNRGFFWQSGYNP
ncbi:MAG: hypothetical protein LR015_03625 [Verrucomicrobia bacterium]|nr:hypothetical protein [Verrucomicrobiota bacterium]